MTKEDVPANINAMELGNEKSIQILNSGILNFDVNDFNHIKNKKINEVITPESTMFKILKDENNKSLI